MKLERKYGLDCEGSLKMVGIEQRSNASLRIYTMFLKLLESQIPVKDLQTTLKFRHASDFANQLNVHVNHLNRSVKEFTQKTTTQVIASYRLQESKTLLKQRTRNVSEIAYMLGFSEPTHFNNFFKKHTQVSPLKFRELYNKSKHLVLLSI